MADPIDAPLETWTVVVDADTTPLQSELKAATGFGRAFSSSLVTAFDGLAVKGKSFGDVLKGVTMSLSNMVIKAAFKPLDQAFGSMMSGLFSGGGETSAFANGGVISGGLPVPFAAGGVIQSPISFPMAGGRTGLAGEAGPEAIMPLTRGADGRLGVAAMGGGGVNVTFNVTATDAGSFARSEAQVSAMLARAVGLGQRNL